jgi:O-antigen/teichoic acid export membrane protein
MKIKVLNSKVNSLWSISSYLFSILVLFFLFPYLVKNLGPKEYGFYIFLATINGIASVGNFGFAEATQRYVAFYFNEGQIDSVKKVLTNTLLLYFLFGFFIGLIIYLFTPQLVNMIKDTGVDYSTSIFLIRVSLLTFIIRFIFGIFESIPKSLQRFDISTKILILENIVRLCFTVLVISNGFGLRGLVLSELIISIVSIFANFFISVNLLDTAWPFGRFSMNILKKMFDYSIYSAMTQIVGLIWQYSDKILLGYFVSSSAVAYFAAPQQMIFKILGVFAAGSAVLFPKFSGNLITVEMRKMCEKYFLLFISLSIVVFSTLALVIEDFMKLWVNEEFARNSKDIAILLSISCMIRGSFSIYENVFKAIGKPQFNFYIILVSSAILLFLNSFLIPKYGLKGAGIAYLFSPLPGIFAMIYVYRFVLNETIKKLIFDFFIPLVIGYGVVLVSIYVKNMLIYKPNWINLFGISAGYVVIITSFLLFKKYIQEFNYKIK